MLVGGLAGGRIVSELLSPLTALDVMVVAKSQEERASLASGGNLNPRTQVLLLEDGKSKLTEVADEYVTIAIAAVSYLARCAL